MIEININQNKNNQKNVAISNFIDKLKNIENDLQKSIIEETLTCQFKIQLVLETIVNQFINLKNPKKKQSAQQYKKIKKKVSMRFRHFLITFIIHIFIQLLARVLAQSDLEKIWYTIISKNI